MGTSLGFAFFVVKRDPVMQSVPPNIWIALMWRNLAAVNKSEPLLESQVAAGICTDDLKPVMLPAQLCLMH